MNQLVTKEVDFNGVSLLTTHLHKSGKNYVVVKWVCEKIGLTEGQIKNERRKIQEDLILRKGIKRFKIKTGSGIQGALHLDIEYVLLWLGGINRKSLLEKQLSNLMQVVNSLLNSQLPIYAYNFSERYGWEAHLRDKIFNDMYFCDYKIIYKEYPTHSGRIDLLAKDKEGHLIGIELKKDKNYNDVISQCLRYKKELEVIFQEGVRMIICTLDNDSGFLEEALLNGIEVYSYKRELVLEKMI